MALKAENANQEIGVPGRKAHYYPKCIMHEGYPIVKQGQEFTEKEVRYAENPAPGADSGCCQRVPL